MRRPGVRIGLIGLATVCLLAGCGGGGAAPLAMTPGAASQLRVDAEAVRAAIAGGDRSQALQALATLESTVAQLRQKGQVSSGRAAAILGAAVDVEAQLGRMPTTTTTTTTTTTPIPADPDRPKGHGGRKGGGD
ncbi:MAG TPA: hypothetical protein VLV81_08000 [Acidimicrobiia bacterium]|nr:hypothetical protein [Acidimicrobiia bacterium]